MTPEERLEAGVKAIQYLQGLKTIPETREQAIEGWNSMTEYEQEFTLKLYNTIITAFPNTGKP